MNEEQSKRLADAAEAVISAGDALNDARDTLKDKRFESSQERERTHIVQQGANKIDNAGRRVEEALRKAVIAAGALSREGAYPKYVEASANARAARALARSAPDQDGIAAKREQEETAIASLETALSCAAALVFGQ